MPVDIGEVMCLVQSWVQEVQDQMIEDYEEKVWEEDFIEDGGPAGLPWELVLEARREEIGFMVQRKIWEVCSTSKCWRLTGKAPVEERVSSHTKPSNISSHSGRHQPRRCSK